MVTPRAISVVVLLLVMLVTSPATGAQVPASDAEQALIERYTPVLMLVPQERACDDRGEPYDAGPTSLVLGDPRIVLRRDAQGQPIVLEGPEATDLAGLDATHYLDYPGNPLRPGCSYERLSRERMEGRSPTTSVHIAREPGREGFAIQYWFFYYFNDFNNTHEGDWEMIQVVFDVDTIEEALTTDPVEVGYAQHGGGEWAAWDDPKLEREGTHPVVYVSRGSHASQFDRAVYLMWGENNTGFGCDITEGADQRVALTPELVAGGADPASVAAWLSFEGRWGQKEAWEFSGPRSPSQSEKWASPLTWQEGLRAESFAVPLSGALGPTPTDVFCTVTGASSYLARLATESLWQTVALIVAGTTVAAALLAIAWRTLAAAVRLYLRHIVVFAPAGLAVVTVGLVVSGVRWLGQVVFEAGPLHDAPEAWSLFAALGHLLQPLITLVLVAPMTIYATSELLAGRRPSPAAMLTTERELLGALVRTLARPIVLIGLLSLVPLGVIPATYLTVLRSFIPQAVVLDHDRAGGAWRRSARFVRGRWWRTAILNGVLGALVLVPSPVIGLLLLIFAARSVELVNLASSVVYALVAPFVFVATTIYYDTARKGEGVRAT